MFAICLFAVRIIVAASFRVDCRRHGRVNGIGRDNVFMPDTLACGLLLLLHPFGDVLSRSFSE